MKRMKISVFHFRQSRTKLSSSLRKSRSVRVSRKVRKRGLMDKILITCMSTKLRELDARALILIKEKVRDHSDLKNANMVILHITVFAGTVEKMATMITNVPTGNIKGEILKGILRRVPCEVPQETLRETLRKVPRETLKGATPILLT